MKDGVIVAHLPQVFAIAQFEITNSNPIILRFVDVVVSARIVARDAGGYDLTEGKVSGRAPVGEMLRAFTVWEDPVSGDLCPGSFAYTQIQKTVCANRDVRESPSDDNKNLLCNAVSFGLSFTAEPALAWGPFVYPYKTTSCFDGSVPSGPVTTDPCSDAGK